MAYLTTALVITCGETNTNMLQPVHNVCHIMDYLCFIPEMYRRDYSCSPGICLLISGAAGGGS